VTLKMSNDAEGGGGGAQYLTL